MRVETASPVVEDGAPAPVEASEPAFSSTVQIETEPTRIEPSVEVAFREAEAASGQDPTPLPDVAMPAVAPSPEPREPDVDRTDELEGVPSPAPVGATMPQQPPLRPPTVDEPPLIVSTLTPAGPVSRYRVTGPWTFAKMMALEQALPQLRGVVSADFTPESEEAVRISLLSNDQEATLQDLLNLPGLHLRMESA
jgi:hypothetical protein